MSPRSALLLLIAVAAAISAWLLFADRSPSGDLMPADPSAGSTTGETRTADTQKGKAAGGPGEKRQAVDGAPGSDSPADPARSCTLRGRLVRPSGEGVAIRIGFRARRSVSAIPLPPPPGEEDAEPIHGQSGADGRFAIPIANVPAGVLTLDGEELVLAKATVGRGILVQTTGPVTDLGDLEVVAAGTVKGQVVAGGMGVAGVEVLVGRDPEPLIGGGGTRVKTDAEGRFAIRGLVPGKLRLDTRSPEYLPARKSLEVAAGETRTDLLIQLSQGGVITGTVVDDRGQPVEGATVSAARSRKLSPEVEYSGFSPGESTTTDASGQFRLAGLSEPAVDLRAAKEGFAAARIARAAAGTANLVLKVARLGRITGTLVTEKGEPIAGSEIDARLAEGPMMRFRGLAQVPVKTDGSGRFAIDGVEPGRNLVTANGAGHVEATEFVEVRPGETAEGVRLTARRGATLTVTVRDDKGQPVPEADVIVESAPVEDGGVRIAHGASRSVRRDVRRARRGDRVITMGDPSELGRAKTDADGIAVVRGLAAGSVAIKATHDALALIEPGKAEVPEGAEAAAELRMRRGGFAQVKVVDTKGEALGNRSFTIVGPRIPGADEPERQGHKVGADAAVRVGPLAPGRYHAVLAQDAKPRSVGGGMSFSLLGDTSDLEDSRVDFTVVADQATDVELVMPVLTTVMGTVVDAAGPVDGAEVELLEEGQIRMPMMGKHRVRTDGEGRFRIEAVPSGRYTLSYNRQGAMVPAEKEVSIARNQPTLEESLTLPGAVLKLQVKDAAKGFGVEDASVSLQRYVPPASPGAPPPQRRQIMMIGISTGAGGGGGGPSTFKMSSGNGSIKTDAKGFAEIPGVPSGKYTLTVSHGEYAKVTRVVEVAEGQRKDLGAVNVEPGCKVRGRVELPENGPMNMCTVEIRNDGDVRETTFSQDGSFRFEGLAPGTYKLRAQGIGAPDWGPEQTVELTPARAARATLTLAKPK